MTSMPLTSTPLVPAMPRILLVEDDPVSRAFLSAAILPLPATVDAADSMVAAMTLANANRYDLWLFDANLPDGSGTELLVRLRQRDATTPALAHTAADDAHASTTLLDAGFQQVLIKPLPSAAVQAALRQALGLVAAANVPDRALSNWNDDIAASALNGNREHIAVLRKLFLAELPSVCDRVRNAFRNEDFQGLHAELHRLRASCGFVGAARLLQATQALGADERSHANLQEFTLAIQALMDVGESSVAGS
jgi:CheY-like chemotaxis protein/HPt (histidine-containing phosphotransfer) domain-containing protein